MSPHTSAHCWWSLFVVIDATLGELDCKVSDLEASYCKVFLFFGLVFDLSVKDLISNTVRLLNMCYIIN